MNTCAKIHVEVDLRKGLPKAIKIKVDQWTHIQQLVNIFHSNARYVTNTDILQIDVAS